MWVRCFNLLGKVISSWLKMFSKCGFIEEVYYFWKFWWIVQWIVPVYLFCQFWIREVFINSFPYHFIVNKITVFLLLFDFWNINNPFPHFWNVLVKWLLILCYYILFIYLLFWDKVLLCIPSWLGTHYSDQGCLELTRSKDVLHQTWPGLSREWSFGVIASPIFILYCQVYWFLL